MNRTLLLVLIIPLFLSCNQTSQPNHIKAFEKIPSFEVLLLDSISTFSTSTLPKDSAVLLFFIDPDCHSCKDEVKMIKENMDILSNAKIIFLGLCNTTDLRRFYYENEFTNYPNVLVAKDHKYAMLNLFRLKSIPSAVLYQKDKKLVKVIEGQTEIGDLKNALKF